MSGHVSFQTSEDYSQSPHAGAGVKTSVCEGAATEAHQAQFMRMAMELRNHSAQNNHNASAPDIDRLLYAIAETGGDLRLSEGDKAGHLAVTLDSITRWIGKAEDRFQHLTKILTHNQRLFSNIAVLVNSQGETVLSQLGATHHIACSTARNLTEVTQAVLQLSTTAQTRSAALRQRISAVQKAINLIEEKLTTLEARMKQDGAKERAQHITDLCRQLDAHSKFAAKNAASSIHFFELVTKKIEHLGEELRAQKKAQTTEATTRQSLTDLAGQLEHFMSAEPDEEKTALGMQESIMKETSCASSALPQPLARRNQQDARLNNTSETTNRVDSGNRELRSRFIAAARYAARQPENGQSEGTRSSTGPSFEAGNRFIRRT